MLLSSYSSFPSHMTNFAASLVGVWTPHFQRLLVLQVLWDRGVLWVMCLCCSVMPLGGEGGREEWKIISDVPPARRE